MFVEAAVGHQLVHEEELAAAMAPADELHEVAVPQPADDPHLRGVLLPPLLGALGHPLDGDVKVHLPQESPVHRPEPAFPELLPVREVVRGNGELAVAEPLWPGPFLELVFHRPCFLVEVSHLPPPPPEKKPRGEAQNHQDRDGTNGDGHANDDPRLGRR